MPDEDMTTRRRFDLDHDDADHDYDTIYVRKEQPEARAGLDEDEGRANDSNSTFIWEGTGGILAKALAKMRGTTFESMQSMSPWSFRFQTPDGGDVVLMTEIERAARDLEAPLHNTKMKHRFEVRAVELPNPF